MTNEIDVKQGWWRKDIGVVSQRNSATAKHCVSHWSLARLTRSQPVDNCWPVVFVICPFSADDDDELFSLLTSASSLLSAALLLPTAEAAAAGALEAAAGSLVMLRASTFGWWRFDEHKVCNARKQQTIYRNTCMQSTDRKRRDWVAT